MIVMRTKSWVTTDVIRKEKLAFHLCVKKPLFRISPDLRTSVYSTAIRFGDYEDYVFLEHKYKIEDYHTERDRIYTGLAATTNKTIMFRLQKGVATTLSEKSQKCDFSLQYTGLPWIREGVFRLENVKFGFYCMFLPL